MTRAPLTLCNRTCCAARAPGRRLSCVLARPLCCCFLHFLHFHPPQRRAASATPALPESAAGLSRPHLLFRLFSPSVWLRYASLNIKVHPSQNFTLYLSFWGLRHFQHVCVAFSLIIFIPLFFFLSRLITGIFFPRFFFRFYSPAFISSLTL